MESRECLKPWGCSGSRGLGGSPGQVGGVISADQGGGVAGQGLESRDHSAQGRRCPSPQVLEVLFHTAAFCNSAPSLPLCVAAGSSGHVDAVAALVTSLRCMRATKGRPLPTSPEPPNKGLVFCKLHALRLQGLCTCSRLCLGSFLFRTPSPVQFQGPSSGLRAPPAHSHAHMTHFALGAVPVGSHVCLTAGSSREGNVTLSCVPRPCRIWDKVCAERFGK